MNTWIAKWWAFYTAHFTRVIFIKCTFHLEPSACSLLFFLCPVKCIISFLTDHSSMHHFKCSFVRSACLSFSCVTLSSSPFFFLLLSCSHYTETLMSDPEDALEIERRCPTLGTMVKLIFFYSSFLSRSLFHSPGSRFIIFFFLLLLSHPLTSGISCTYCWCCCCFNYFSTLLDYNR